MGHVVSTEHATPDWRHKAACREYDPELWWAFRDTEEHDFARDVCEDCPVRRACGEFAQSRRVAAGIWGGFDVETQKRALGRWLMGDEEQPEVGEARAICASCGEEFAPGYREPRVCHPCASGLVAAAPVAEFVRGLLGAGWSLRDVSEDAGVSRDVLRQLMHPTKPSRYVSQKTRDALMRMRVTA